MTSPKPPAPTNVASVAIPTVKTVAVRIPAIIKGKASGNSICFSICVVVIPIPRPASMIDESTDVSPVYVFRKIGKKRINNKRNKSCV